MDVVFWWIGFIVSTWMALGMATVMLALAWEAVSSAVQSVFGHARQANTVENSPMAKIG